MTAGIAALALGASPALAGSDGCSGDCDAENAPPVAGVAPIPVAPQPIADAPDQSAPSDTQERTRRVHRTHAVSVVQRTVPRGAVAAGAGGTAPAGPNGTLALLASGALVLVAAGGGLVASGRRSTP
jgi:hypothetical protein